MPILLRRTHYCTAALVAAVLALGCATTETAVPSERDAVYVKTGHQVNPEIGLSVDTIEEFLAASDYENRATRPGVWRISVDGVLVLLVAEEGRVRILAPIFALNQLDTAPAVQHALMVRLLQSNFERSVDARYSLFDGIVFATVTHPRPSLKTGDLDSFLKQVVNLHKNTFRTGGRAYSSSTPEADSVEIDPRLDETLLLPEAFERGLAVPKEKKRRTERTRPTRDTRIIL